MRFTFYRRILTVTFPLFFCQFLRSDKTRESCVYINDTEVLHGKYDKMKNPEYIRQLVHHGVKLRYIHFCPGKMGVLESRCFGCTALRRYLFTGVLLIGVNQHRGHGVVTWRAAVRFLGRLAFFHFDGVVQSFWPLLQ